MFSRQFVVVFAYIHAHTLTRCVYTYIYILKETKVDQNCSIKTRSKPISSRAASIREAWRDMPWTDQNNEAQFTKLLPTSKRLVARNSLLPERGTAEQPRQRSQQLTSSAPTVQDSVPLGWGCGATSVFIDELQNASVIIGSDGQLPYICVCVCTRPCACVCVIAVDG